MNLIEYIPLPLLSLTVEKFDDISQTSGLYNCNNYIRNILMNEVRLENILHYELWLIADNTDIEQKLKLIAVYDMDQEEEATNIKSIIDDNYTEAFLMEFDSKVLYLDLYMVEVTLGAVRDDIQIFFETMDDIYDEGWTNDVEEFQPGVLDEFNYFYPDLEDNNIYYNKERRYYAILNEFNHNTVNTELFTRLYEEALRIKNYE